MDESLDRGSVSEDYHPTASLPPPDTLSNSSPYPWDRELIKVLLRSPTRLLRDSSWWPWFRRRGGLTGVYTYLRQLPLSREERKLLELLLDQPRDPAQVYMQVLQISRSTYFHRLQMLLELLAEHLNAWIPEQPLFAPLPIAHEESGTPPEESFPLMPSSTSIPLYLPSQPTSLIGREKELATLQHLLQHPAVRSVTLTGPGGIGKTRLAIHVARDLAPSFAHGVAFVSLATSGDPAMVMSAIAQALGVKERAPIPIIERVKSYLRERQLLLVLDNFEQVTAAGIQLAELLAATLFLKILVTSRVPLHIYGEHRLLLPPLPLPDKSDIPLAALLSFPAVALFLERARAIDHNFALTAQNSSTIVEICRRLDGLPLAIELAASQIKWFPPQDISARLTNCLETLIDGPQDQPPRQQTLRGTIDWSYKLLEPPEQHIFEWLGVFEGECVLDAAEAVCSRIANLGDNVRKVILALIDKSMVQRVDGLNLQTAGQTASPEVRVRLLGVMREYALERLAKRGEVEQVRSLHASYYLELAEAAELEFTGPQHAQWIERLKPELDNIRAALRWMLSQGNHDGVLRLSMALFRLWEGQGLLSEGRRWIETVLKQNTTASELVVAKAYRALGLSAATQGDYQQAAYFHEQCLALTRKTGDPYLIARALNNRGVVELCQANFEPAASLLSEGLIYANMSGQLPVKSFLLTNLGVLALHQGDYPRASDLLGQGLHLARRTKRLFLVGYAMTMLGVVRFGEQNYEKAKTLLKEALQVRQSLSDTEGFPETIEALAMVAEAEGALERAACLWGVAERGRELLGNPIPPAYQAFIQRMLPDSQSRLPRTPWAADWERGRSMTWEEAIEYALSSPTPEARHVVEKAKAATSPYPSQLSAREAQVVQLVVQGLTDREIATRLLISPRTVDSHLRRIFHKVHVNTRAGLVAWAIRHGVAEP